MAGNMVITNLRIPESDYLRIKARAQDLGMSLNGYFNYLITKLAPRNSVAIKSAPQTSFYQALRKLANKPYKRKPMGASEEDKIIYGID